MGHTGAALLGSHDYRLVVLSILIAISASYAALELGGRVTAARGWVRSGWLAGGASAMGCGIWSMHFTGMLAFHLPVPVAYDWPTVLLSLLPAIFASAVALYVVSRKKMGRVEALTGSLVMGLGIAGMHYIGMAAMRLPAVCHYSPLLVAVSLLIAIIASLAALVFAFDYREAFRGTTLAKVISAVVMGAAISLMHYTGMMSASFVASAVLPDMSHAVSISSLGLSGIAVGTLMVQGVAILTSEVDRRFAMQAQELQTSDRFRQIADNLQVVLALTNADFTELLYVNHTYQMMWGRTLQSVYAEPKSWLEGIHPEDRGRVEECLQRLIGGEPIDNLECRVVRPDGSTSWVACRGFPIRDAEDHVYRLVASAQDITQRKRAEEALRQAEDRIRLTIDTIPTMAWSVRPDGTVDFVNKRWLEYTGLSLEEEIEEPTRVVHPEDLPMVMEKWRAYMAAGKPSEDEMRLRRADGEYRWFLVRTAPLRDEQGNLVKWYGLSIDIEDRKQAEEELRRLSGKLLRLQDEERRKIARDLHDSTGQNLVVLATYLAQLQASIPSTSGKSRKLVSESQALADQCIREVRTLSYLLHPPMLEEAGLGDAIRLYLEGFTKRSGIQVDLEVSRQFGRLDRDVELTLFRVVQESLTNIQRHSGSPLTNIRLDRDASKVTLEISDHGRGASAGVPRGKEEPGFEVGVGIPSMKERVKLIGGRLEIDSTSQGTTVRVTMPLGGEPN